MRPLTILLLALLGLLWMDIAVGYKSLSGCAYSGMVLGFAIGAIVRSKEN